MFKNQSPQFFTINEGSIKIKNIGKQVVRVREWPGTNISSLHKVMNVYKACRDNLLLNLDPSSKFLTTEQAFLYCTDTSKYHVGDKLFVYCEPYVAESYPPYISGKWVYRYYKAEQ